MTCEDWKATWRVFVNPQFDVVSRAGYQDIKSVTCKGKEGTVVFTRPFAAWETLVVRRPLRRPRHPRQEHEPDVQQLDPGLQWAVEILELAAGRSAHVVKNPRYKAGPPMKLDRVVFRFILDTNARFQAMKAGEGHVMEPQPQLQIADFLNDRSSRSRKRPSTPSSTSTSSSALGPSGAEAAVRAPGADHGDQPDAGLTALYRTIAPGLPKLDNLVFKTFESSSTSRTSGSGRSTEQGSRAL